MSERYINMDNGADLITVFTGFNDFSRDVPLGSQYDTTNNTYYGALDVLLKGLVQKFPNKKIGLISMYGVTQYPENNIWDIPDYAYVNAEIDVCDRYHIKHLNLYEIDSMNLATDGAMYKAPQNHLNNLGHEHLAEIMEPFIESL
ncbi:SGNH/GDSL hydrolase family protein [Listeria fleischmannii]|nr:SGNH/GDSL hydrolase family protein [Listeria fleischmannii]